MEVKTLIIFAQVFVILLPIIEKTFWGNNLFVDNGFPLIYIINLVLLTINNLTDFTVEIPGLKLTLKNTGSSNEVIVNFDKREYRVITHGSTDTENTRKLMDGAKDQLK